MLRLAAMLYSIISPSLAGTGVIAVLVAGYVSVPAIVASAAVGAILAVPVSYVIATKLIKAGVARG